MSETIDYKVQVVTENGAPKFIDIEPPLTERQKRLMLLAPYLCDFRKTEASIPFQDQTPDVGEPFTEIEASGLQRAADELELMLDVKNVAGHIVDFLTEQGMTVKFKSDVPLESRGYQFVGLVNHAPSTPPQTDN